MSASADAVGRMLETVDRLSRRLNALEAEKRDAPPFQRGPVQPQRSPEQRFQDSEYAAGRLTEVTETDRTGRQVVRFYGHPSCWLDQFKLPTKVVRGFKI